MAKVIVEDTNLKRIADAIRSKNNETEEYTPYNMADKISELETTDINEYFKTSGFKATGSSSTLIMQSVQKIPSSLDLEGLTSLSYGFAYYKGTELPQIDTSNITSMSTAFTSCVNIKTIPLLNTSKVTNMQDMFTGCTALESIPLIDTHNVTTMENMFKGCTNLKLVPLLNTSKVTNMSSMFSNCSELEEIPLFDTSNVTTMYSMFYNYGKNTKFKTVPLFNTSKVTTMAHMFNGCDIESVPLFDTSSVTTFQYTFTGCDKLTTIPQWDTSSAKSMYGMFSNCSSLETVPLLDCSKVTEITNIFERSYSMPQLVLANLGGFKDLGKAYTQKSKNYSSYSLKLSFSGLITHDSLMNVINNLYDLNITYGVYDEEGNPGDGVLYTQQLILGTTNLAKLTEEEIAIATNKGWTVSA